MKVDLKKFLVITCGIILLLSPTILRTTGAIKTPESGLFNRQPVFPHLEISHLLSFKPGKKSVTSAIVRYYSEICGFRELLVPLYLEIKSNLFHVSPYPDKVVYGQQGWFFLGDEYSHVISESKGLINFSEQELKRIEDNMLNTQEYCRRRNIRFYLALAPDKSDVYGCYLPIEKANRPTKVDQVVTRLSKCNFRIINLGKDFTLYNNRQLYLKTDSHWNQFGLFIGYQTLMNAIKTDFPDIQPLNINQFVIDTVDDYKGDLTSMMSLKRKDQRIEFKSKIVSEVSHENKRLPVPEGYTLDPTFYERRFFNKKGNHKTLIIHDSFFHSMPKFMKENFRESVFLWCYFDYRIIDREKPELVIYELAGREIDALLQDHVIL